MANYISNVLDPNNTPQTEPLADRKQVKNSAGGFVFAVDNWTRLDRWLVLGSEGGSFYASERDLTKQNIDGLKAALAENGVRFINTVVEVSHAGRAPKNEPALFALALAAADKRQDVSAYALAKLPEVARIPTHLFAFVEFVSALRGWGRALRSGVAEWYLSKPSDQLSYQLAKYQSRNGWSHRDVLRLCHAHPKGLDHQALLHWAVKGWDSVGEAAHENPVLAPIWAFERAKKLDVQTGVKELIRLIADYNLPRECVPTEFLNEVSVWDALLQKMPVTATIRNLGKMTSIGLIGPNSAAAKIVSERLADINILRKARLHPISVLLAQSTYKSGHGMKGNLSWSPVPRVVNSLEQAFYDSFVNAPKTGKRFYLGLDVSGSMASGNVAGTPLTPRDASAALAMVTMRTESDYYIAGFTGGAGGYGMRAYSDDSITPLALNPNMSLTDAVRTVSGLPFGSTDCALPMIDALRKKIPVDAFVIYTDSETYASGSVHPTVALQEYRNKMGIDAKLIVVGLVSNDFTIADPTDSGQMDVVGFNSSVPQVIAEFVGTENVAVAEEEEAE